MSSFTTPLAYEPTGKTSGSGFNLPLYRVTESFTYNIGDLDSPFDVVTVPVGFITDFASIPKPFNYIFRPDGPWAKAAVIHDYLYETYPTVNKLIFDGIFYEACRVLNVNFFISLTFFMFIRTFQIGKSDAISFEKFLTRKQNVNTSK